MKATPKEFKARISSFKLGEGNMTIEDSGQGYPTLVCVPGLGDTRGQFRELVPQLTAAGFRVITVDPRGQGDSDGTFTAYTARVLGEDLVQLIQTLDSDIYLIGNSSGGAAAAWAAASRPDKVKGLVLLAAFLRDHPMGFFQKLGLSLALRGPWARSAWISYYKSLFISRQPQDQAAYTARLNKSLKRPGHIKALRALAFASKADVTARLGEIRQPVLAIGGGRDPDFTNPEDEINWIVESTRASKLMIPEAGHYPHLEKPDEVSRAILGFVKNS